MIAGLALCFIGIKHNQLQIFLSTTLLLTLAIEVLIVYVMNPPVSDAVQGGYLVAGVIPGFIGGGVAMVFKEMTEGNGCFLGGFCFAMWLLCLAPGGLIAAKIGRIIVILVFACIAWAADWSRYTRTYGIIVCTAFAGSTAFILGVDCFSRAGLKEFWLYNWDLNANVFPLGTTTYPLTRNIQVEEACIVVVAVLGILTQFQIWKVIRAHREKQDEARRQDEENREQDELARRGALEERNQRERRIWENTYGNKTKDSGIGSSIDSGPQKGDMGISVRELDLDEHEKELGRVDSLPHSHDAYPLADLRPQSSTNADDRSVEGLILSEPAISRKPTWASSQKGAKGLAKRFSSASMKLRTRQRDSAAPSFRNSGLRLADRESNDFSFVNSPNLNSGDGQSKNEHDQDDCPEDEEEIEDIDDRASSVAATMAEDPDFTAFSRPASQHMIPSSPRRFSKFSLNDLVANALNKDIQFPHVDDDDDDEVVAKRAISPKPAPATTETNALDSHDKAATEAASTEADEVSATGRDDAPAVALSAELLPRSMSRAAHNYRTNEWAKEAGRDAEPIAEDEICDPYAEEPVMVAREDAAARARAEENNAAPQPAPPPPAKEPAVKTKRLSPDMGPRASKANSSRLSSEPASSAVDTPFNRSQVSSRRQSTMSATDPALPSKSQTSAEETIAETGLVASPVEDIRLSYFAMDSLTQAQADQAARAKAKASAAAAAAALVSPSKTTLLDVRNERIQARQTTTSFMSMDARASTPDLLGNLSTTDLHANAYVNQPVADPGMGIHPLLRSQTPDPMTAMAVEETRSPEDMTLAERKALIQGSRPGSTTSFYQQLSNAPAATPAAAARRSSQSSPYTPLNGSTTNLISTINSPPRMLTSPTPLAAPASTHIYANTRPARTQSSTFDASKQAYIREQWLSSNAAAATADGPGTAAGAAAADSHLARLHALRQQVAAEAAAKEAAAKQRQDQRDAALRMGVAAENHRAALARMQSQAHVGPSSKGSVYPEAKAAATPAKARGRTSTEITGAGNGEAPRRRGSSAMGFRRRLSGRE